MPVSRRYELLGWAASSDKRYIIEDEYDSEFRFDRHPIPALQTMDVQDKVIYINTFTKTLSSTIRVSYMVLPQSLAEKYYKKCLSTHVQCQILNSIHWQSLLTKAILKNISTGCRSIILIRGTDF